MDFTAVLQPCLVHTGSTPIPEEDRCHDGKIVECVHDTVQMLQTKTSYTLARAWEEVMACIIPCANHNEASP